MRESELWERLEQAVGHSYARSWAMTVVLSELGGRTVQQALAAGIDHKDVWRAAWAHLGLADRER